MPPRTPAQQLAYLREIRPIRQTSEAVGGDHGLLVGIVDSLKREDSYHFRLQRALSRELPPELATACTLIESTGHHLTLQVPNAATRFRLDRWLRSGGEKQLLAANQGKHRHIRIKTLH